MPTANPLPPTKCRRTIKRPQGTWPLADPVDFMDPVGFADLELIFLSELGLQLPRSPNARRAPNHKRLKANTRYVP